jgi:hypothetical protein
MNAECRPRLHNDLRGHTDRIHLVTGLCTVRHSVRACSGAPVLRRDGARETSNGRGVELASKSASRRVRTTGLTPCLGGQRQRWVACSSH